MLFTPKIYLRVLVIASLNTLFFSRHIKSFFERFIFNPYYGPSADEGIIKTQYEALLKYADSLSGKKILEIGPGGDYSLACHFLRLGAKKVWLIDTENHIHPSKQDIKRYQAIYPPLIEGGAIDSSLLEVLTYDATGGIPLQNESMDIVFSNAVFEHVEEPELRVF
jgi:2-polyprenyl-3-methyl-5-hydroxy-6-metoxy-1,4-benzoquinol methylase